MEKKKIIPTLSESEKYNFKDPLSRSSKAIPQLIADGYVKKYPKDATRESNKTDMGLCQSKNIYRTFALLTAENTEKITQSPAHNLCAGQRTQRNTLRSFSATLCGKNNFCEGSGLFNKNNDHPKPTIWAKNQDLFL